jgi:hypothetical protein
VVDLKEQLLEIHYQFFSIFAKNSNFKSEQIMVEQIMEAFVKAS